MTKSKALVAGQAGREVGRLGQEDSKGHKETLRSGECVRGLVFVHFPLLGFLRQGFL